MTTSQMLHRVFDADRAALAAESDLLQGDRGELEATLTAAVDEALALPDRDEAVLRLERLADLCGQVQGAAMADALIRILGDDEPSVRYQAGEALLELGYDRYAEVARAIDRAVEAGLATPAAAEIPGIIAEIGEPSTPKQLRPFLRMEDPDAVAAAIEALAAYGDPAASELLEPLTDDTRIVTLDGADDSEASIGDLASDAIRILAGE